jgi:iduronate 2-sulfatase
MYVNHRFLQAGFVASGSAFALTADCGESSHPNVLFVISDDLNEAIGCWGHPVVKTPNIDRLSRNGIRFQRAYCQFSVCNPSRASFLTGLRPKNTGVRDICNGEDFREVHPDMITLPQYFRQNGYWTGTVGKSFHRGERDADSWSWCADWNVNEGNTTGNLHNPSDGKLPWCKWRQVESGTIVDDRITELAVEKLALLDQSKPFFLTVGFIRPHNPYFAPKEFFDLYPLETLQLPVDSDFETNPDIPASAYGWKEWYAAYSKMDQSDKKELLRAYYACVSYMDDRLGRVLKALEEKGVANNTIIVFTSDHGYHNWEKGWWAKSTVWEMSARVPLIIAGDCLPEKEQDCFRIVEMIDICPTLVELCGLSSFPARDGRSLVPLLRHPAMDDAEWGGAAFTEFGAMRSVRTEQWRYCRWNDDGDEALYRYSGDPDESFNLLLDTVRSEVVNRIRNLMRSAF